MKRLFTLVIIGLLSACSISKDQPASRDFIYLYGDSGAWVGAFGKSRGSYYDFKLVPDQQLAPTFDSVWVDGKCFHLVKRTGKTDTLFLHAEEARQIVPIEPIEGQESKLINAAMKAVKPPVETLPSEALLRYRHAGVLKYIKIPVQKTH